MGNRVGETVNGATQSFLLDQAGPLPLRIAATDANGMERFVYGLSRVLIIGTDDLYRYQHADGRGVLLDTATYAPFGARLMGGGAFGFTGEPQSAATGLVHLRARDYSPTLGRFTSEDRHPTVLVQPQTFNRYGYVLNNPVNSVDPRGLYPECAWWDVGCHARAIGAAITSFFSGGSDTSNVAPAPAVQRKAKRKISNTSNVAPAPPPPTVETGSSVRGLGLGLVGPDGGSLISDAGSGLIGPDGASLAARGVGQ